MLFNLVKISKLQCIYNVKISLIMGRLPNDGRGRIGGRAKGTKNNPKKPLNDWAAALINRRRAQFEKDLDALTPGERAAVLGPIIAATVGGGYAAPQEPEPVNP